MTLSEPGDAWLSDAWTKFDRSESTTNILKFLQSVYKTKESHPDYICIDKECQVLQTAVTNGSWDAMWKKTSRFIYCNPSLGDGSAPNLVIIAYDNNGNAYAQKAFNIQMCEQLNGWLGGFESIFIYITPGNFNWFLQTMLFYHTKYVIAKQKRKAESSYSDDENEELGLDEETSDSDSD
ncbi:hypothetical protein CVT25_007823 [Psilocybe cyanescens]|uniref:MULE transposase domain-containing protein n=1 Tax=Psilocybe cyanescens TaxID=93625 RepID=A0A409XL92_PSICY|nr:hypothetical protein CVT25_007823 [Psilocybe cyanescens]